MWIETSDGRMVNSDHVKDIKEVEGPSKPAQLLLEDGQTVFSTKSYTELKTLLLPSQGRQVLMEGK